MSVIPIHQRASEIGAAGEYIVCADLILQGLTAYPAAAALAYDVLIDRRGVLIRVAVKSTTRPRARPARENSRIVYNFAVSRPRRLRTGKTDARGYTKRDVDIVAFCALDLRMVAYCHLSECARTMHFDPLDASPPRNRRGLIPGRSRKTFAAFTIARALAIHFGETAPTPLKGHRL